MPNSQIKPKILFASTNNHKIRLFKMAWNSQGLNQKFELITPSDLPKIQTEHIEENSGSFTGDALIKAQSWAKIYNLPTISQDRGFVFEALNWPGTDSKKVMFGDEKKISDSQNWESEKTDNLERAKKVLAKIDGKNRNMTVIQALAIVLPNGEFVVEEKINPGVASEKVIDKIGGAFDWFFIPKDLNQTLSQFVTKEQKEQYEAENLYPITPKIIDFLTDLNCELDQNWEVCGDLNNKKLETNLDWHNLEIRNGQITLKIVCENDFINYQRIWSKQNPEEIKSMILRDLEWLNCQKAFKFSIFDQDNFVGVISLRDLDTLSPEFGLWILSEFRNKGLATTALRTFLEWIWKNLPVKKIYYKTGIENLASQKVAQKCDFVKENTHEIRKYSEESEEKLLIFSLENPESKTKIEDPKQHFHLISCGVSGGEEGALNGPSIMPSGEPQIVNQILPILEKIAARDFENQPCVTNVGLGPSGHFVKMVHNGIEYALMQGIAEIYGILRYNQYSNQEMVWFFSSFVGENSVDGYLLEITRKILQTEDSLELESSELEKKVQNSKNNSKNIHLIGIFCEKNLENWAKIIKTAEPKFDKIILHLITQTSEFDKQKNEQNTGQNDTTLVKTWQKFTEILNFKSEKNAKSELLESQENLENKIILGSLGGINFAGSSEIDKVKESLEVMFQIRNLTYEPFYKKLFPVSQFFSKNLVVQEGKDSSNYEYSQVKKFYIPHFGNQKEEFDSLLNELFYQSKISQLVTVVDINYEEDVSSDSDLRPIAFDSVGFRQYDNEFGIKPNDVIYVIDNTSENEKNLEMLTKMLVDLDNKFELDLEILTSFEIEFGAKNVKIEEFAKYLNWRQKPPKTTKKDYLLDKIKPIAASKGTGIWTVQTALELGVAVPTLAEALFVRSFSNNRPKIKLSSRSKDIDADWGGRFGSGDKLFLQMSLESVFAASFIQGIHLIQEANEQFGWQINIQEVLRIWQGGCIIRTKMLPKISQLFKNGKVVGNSFIPFLPHQSFGNLTTCISCPVIWSAINYMYAFWSEDLPTNLIQAQRDFFGAHTFERIDKPGTFSGGWEK